MVGRGFAEIRSEVEVSDIPSKYNRSRGDNEHL